VTKSFGSSEKVPYLCSVKSSKHSKMATAIKAIPTLYGDEARRFQEMANAVEDNYNPRKEQVMSPRQQSAYEFLKREGWLK